ncbi:DUF305 domain-containing protein [Streptomyces sp. NBC_01408]|uniref:DUF305 domain-containing protein n=1 Tax=Streptomyces sp. NBC_01408 TaxID=2903855 RepID=UPI0022502EE6|nr:DUF305 domain-containing protein [Streptomyces sp. NBC_01408]MCX4696206.1 DUF305 domain-containing protein [Streptomyces sp. NBC_01408]
MTSNRSFLRRSPVRRAAAVVTASAAALVLAACGSDDGGAAAGHNGHPAASPSVTAPGTPGRHNAADVAFATGMIPHHRQAVEMADLAPGRAESGQVKRLAEEIKKAQDPEIKTLSGWLASWGEPVPAAGTTDAADHTQHGSGGGMMSAEEMDELSKTSGKAFDTAFMELMIKHHEGAVEMARTEKSQGSFPEAKTMADAIISSQSAEIDTMKGLLGKS